MNCDYVQERLSAFLDREESNEEMVNVLSHLYGCDECQKFFNTTIRLRSFANEERRSYPFELNEAILQQVHNRRKASFLNYRFKLPVYVASIAAIILVAISFALGFMVQENVHQKEMDIILKAPPSEVVYGMPATIVYPVMNQQTNGGVR